MRMELNVIWTNWQTYQDILEWDREFNFFNFFFSEGATLERVNINE